MLRGSRMKRFKDGEIKNRNASFCSEPESRACTRRFLRVACKLYADRIRRGNKISFRVSKLVRSCRVKFLRTDVAFLDTAICCVHAGIAELQHLPGSLIILIYSVFLITVRHSMEIFLATNVYGGHSVIEKFLILPMNSNEWNFRTKNDVVLGNIICRDVRKVSGMVQ